MAMRCFLSHGPLSTLPAIALSILLNLHLMSGQVSILRLCMDSSMRPISLNISQAICFRIYILRKYKLEFVFSIHSHADALVEASRLSIPTVVWARLSGFLDCSSASATSSIAEFQAVDVSPEMRP